MNEFRCFILPLLIFSSSFLVIGNNILYANRISLLKESKINSNLTNPNKPRGHVSYKLVRAAKPNKDELSAYKLIIQVMDSAISYYNWYTMAKKQITVYYVVNKSVNADGNFNGNIRFGSDKSFINVGTAIHEISHTIGIGTSVKWKSFMSLYAPTGQVMFKGKNATNMLRQITGDKNAKLFMDSKHFWPNGLNYVSEYKTESDLINNCKIVNAMLEDGL